MASPIEHYLTIEELRSTLNSCWLCGCNWSQDHVSLDCSECGGYGLSRPCPSCDGKCKQQWRRNIHATHNHHKALWEGQCKLRDCQQCEQEPGVKVASSSSKSSRESASSLSSKPASHHSHNLDHNHHRIGSSAASSKASSSSSSNEDLARLESPLESPLEAAATQFAQIGRPPFELMRI